MTKSLAQQRFGRAAADYATSEVHAKGESLKRCEECDAKIPEGRRKALPGVRLCVSCQEAHDADAGVASGYNRRGSKDSQLR